MGGKRKTIRDKWSGCLGENGARCQNLHTFHHLNREESSQKLAAQGKFIFTCVGSWRGKKHVWEMKDAQMSPRSDVSETPWAKVHCPCLAVIWAGLAHHTVAANAASVQVSLPRWSLFCSHCQHPYFSRAQCCGLREENFNGNVVTQPGADQCLWVWPYLTAKADWRRKHVLSKGCVAKAAVRHGTWGSCPLVESSAVHEAGDSPAVIRVETQLLICSHTECCVSLGAVLVQQGVASWSGTAEDSQWIYNQNMQLLTKRVFLG